MPARGAHPVGFLAEVEVRREHVLGQVHREVPDQHVERLGRRVTQHLGHHAQQRDREHEPGAEREAGVDHPQAPALVSHHGERADHVAERRGDGEAERVHSRSRASASRRLALVEAGIVEHPVEQRGEHLADPRPRCAQRLQVGSRDRQVAARRADRRARGSRPPRSPTGPAALRGARAAGSRSSAARPTAASQRRTARDVGRGRRRRARARSPRRDRSRRWRPGAGAAPRWHRPGAAR